MKINEVEIKWNDKFEGVLPLDFQFKHDLYKRWFRIHYLPKSKRYPETLKEYEIVSQRQQKVLDDLIGEFNKISLLIGYFNYDQELKSDLKTNLGKFKKFKSIDLFDKQNKIQFGPYEEGESYETYILQIDYQFDLLKNTLLEIANDNYKYRFSIVDMNRGRIVVPYDGGMDIIMENIDAKITTKTKYKDWLSNREDGL